MKYWVEMVECVSRNTHSLYVDATDGRCAASEALRQSQNVGFGIGRVFVVVYANERATTFSHAQWSEMCEKEPGEPMTVEGESNE